MEWVALATVMIIAVVAGTSGLMIRSYRHRQAQPVPPYELHRARWERTGDPAELEAMIAEAEKGEK